jgi:DNA repair exonuclease SbcCD nuclease subunit
VSGFSFIHAADLHIGSAFRGVSAEAPEFRDHFQQSTFRAYENLIQTATDHAVDFVLIAGDVYDGADRSLFAQLAFNDGLRRLAGAGIRAFVVHGNHDPLDGRIAQTEQLEGVTIFGPDAETVVVEVGGQPVVSISGISFPKRDVRSNLARRLEPGAPGLFRIGLLHSNVGSNTGHDPYAPCELSELRSSGMSYWALGHVHTRQVMSEEPHVVYPGNPQGRSVRETGERGCYLVRVDDQHEVALEFLPLDVVRWHEVEVSIEEIETLDALERSIGERIDALAHAGEDRGVVCRVEVPGRGPLYGDLRKAEAEPELLARVRERYSDTEPLVWVQRLRVACRPSVDLAKRAAQGDLLAEVLAVGQEYAAESAKLDELGAEVLGKLWDNARAKKGLESLDPEALRELVFEAQLLCLDLLEEGS